MKRACVWVAREWIDGAGKTKREKKPDRTLKGVKPADKWVVQWLDETGKRRLEKVDELGRAGMEAAFARRAEIETLLRNGEPVKHRRDAATDARSVAQAGTWAAFRDSFDRLYLGSGRLRPSTVASYKHSLDLFQKLCKPAALADVRTVMLDEFRDGLAKETGGGVNAVNKHLRVLRLALRQAHHWELIEKLPRFGAIGSTANEPRPVSDEDFAALYATMGLPADKGGPRFPCGQLQHYSAGDWWRAVLVTASYTGLRMNEWRLLPWDDVSLDRAELVIRKARNKSKRDDRIPMHPIVVSHLRKLWDYGRLVFPFVRYWAGSDRELELTALYDEWRRLLKAAGMERRYTFHNLRDTCLSRFGRSMSATQLHVFSRHASFATTQRHYLDPATVLEGCLDRVNVPEFLG